MCVASANSDQINYKSLKVMCLLFLHVVIGGGGGVDDLEGRQTEFLLGREEKSTIMHCV